jgi:FixJ family two-component response regulator/anti-sigma regulatory factor (Ser/Thr protein kinase)
MPNTDLPPSAFLLVVEDDRYSRDFLRASLTTAGYHVVVAKSGSDAMAWCENNGLANCLAVLTDYRMPRVNGMDLYYWLRAKDPQLAVAIVTGQGQSELVKEALTAGVCGYLEKPLTHDQILDLAARCVERTVRDRALAAGASGLRDAGQIERSAIQRVASQLQPWLQVYGRPLHEVGGDFVNLFNAAPDGSACLVLGDVSGHDFKAGIVASYVQGLLRGALAGGRSLDDCLPLINEALQGDTVPLAASHAGIQPSVCLGCYQIDRQRATLSLFSYGLPGAVLIDRYGFVTVVSPGEPPLGWLDAIKRPVIRVPTANLSAFYCFSDGILETAERLGVDYLTLLYNCFHRLAQNAVTDPPPSDDILALRYEFNPPSTMNDTFEPILSEQYSGAEFIHIDDLQSIWRRSLQYALAEQLGDRLYEVLICIREGMLNALIHGCGGSSEKFCHLQIAVNAAKETVRIRIDDPGKGHNFDVKKRFVEATSPMGRHLGLGIVQHLSDAFKIENKGSSLIFDFEYAKNIVV